MRTPFLHRLLGGVATEVLEQALIDAGSIQALGFRWAGVAAPPKGGAPSPESGMVQGAIRDWGREKVRPIAHCGTCAQLSAEASHVGHSRHHSHQRPTPHLVRGGRSLAEAGRSAGIQVRATSSSWRMRRWSATSRRGRFASSGSLRARRSRVVRVVALMEAIDRFDPVKGASFEQYAWTRVAGALVDELRKQDWASRSVRREGRRIERARDSSSPAPASMPTELELASELGATVEELRLSIEDIDRSDVSSLNAPSRGAEDSLPMEVGETIQAPEGEYDPEPACSVPTGTRLCVPGSPACPIASATFSRSSMSRSSPVPRSAGCSASASRACPRSSRGSGAS